MYMSNRFDIYDNDRPIEETEDMARRVLKGVQELLLICEKGMTPLRDVAGCDLSCCPMPTRCRISHPTGTKKGRIAQRRFRTAANHAGFSIESELSEGIDDEDGVSDAEIGLPIVNTISYIREEVNNVRTTSDRFKDRFNQDKGKQGDRPRDTRERNTKIPDMSSKEFHEMNLAQCALWRRRGGCPKYGCTDPDCKRGRHDEKFHARYSNPSEEKWTCRNEKCKIQRDPMCYFWHPNELADIRKSNLPKPVYKPHPKVQNLRTARKGKGKGAKGTRRANMTEQEARDDEQEMMMIMRQQRPFKVKIQNQKILKLLLI